MVSFLIRHATLDDLNAIVQLDQGSNPHPWNASLIEEALMSRANWVIEATLEADDTIAQKNETTLLGWLTASLLFEQSELELIVVDRTQRRQGFAKQLLSAWTEEMASKGVVEYLLEVRESNLGAIQLYRSLGFEEVGRRKNYYVTDQGKEAACLFTLSV